MDNVLNEKPQAEHPGGMAFSDSESKSTEFDFCCNFDMKENTYV